MSKKILSTFLMLFLLISFFSMPVVKASAKEDCENTGYCEEYIKELIQSGNACEAVPSKDDFSCRNANIQKAVRLVANILFYIRIIVPIVIVIVGTVSFAKAVLSQDDNDIKEVFYGLLKKIIIGVIIFVLPTIVIAVMKNVASSEYNKDESWTCCINLLK